MHSTAHGPDAVRHAPRIAFAVQQDASGPQVAPISLTEADGSALVLRVLSAQSRIDGPLAQTELHLTFHNPEPRVREGRFRMVLPRGAFLSRLAMKINGAYREADVAELARAREVYESVMHVRRDPLLVEQHGDEELSARVFPIDADGDKEIVVAWIATVSASSPVTIPLRGMPEIVRLDTSCTEGGQLLSAVHGADVTPTDDVRFTPTLHASAIRNGDLLVARVVVPRADGSDVDASIAGHHALAMALLRAGANEEAFDALASAASLTFAARYGRARDLIEQDLAFVAAAWAYAEPARAGGDRRTRARTRGPLAHGAIAALCPLVGDGRKQPRPS